MRVMLMNPGHPAIGSRIPREQLPPLGLLFVGGSLVDAGHEVKVVDGEFGPMGAEEMAEEAFAWRPEILMVGHSGSTSGHPSACAVMRAVKRRLPKVRIVYGGVFPTYHWREVLRDVECVDVVVRGEGEKTIRAVVRALEEGTDLGEVEGIAYRDGGRIVGTRAAAMIENLDEYRVGWELVDLKRYGYWGGKRAVVVQFSRGCPHLCSYCGQRGFWTKWRHRDPVKLAEEIAWLHRRHGVEVFNFADENPTASRKAWKAFLEALIATGVKVTLVGSTRADDIVRDADILHLYKQAGVERWLMGMENYDAETLKKIRKGGSMMKDRQAIQLLRKHGILSMATWVVGFEEERDRDLWRGLRQLLRYDPDQIQMLYATPHRWTPLFGAEKHRRVIQMDQSKWDYKHQVLATRHMAAWRVFVWVKFIEVVMQMRPRALKRVLWHWDRKIRHAQRWYYKMGRRVWFHEVFGFFARDKRVADGPTVGEWWREEVDGEEALVRLTVRRVEKGRHEGARSYGAAERQREPAADCRR
ncbi:MAG TPA: magnesium-protoporphyrin IX monomethyl ester anaerobic oxidative cyclase [Phycisphaerae bacterium]|nr:magnesium-protoporphyrin IX monomethyl ester anaerobic oxidative cyclase [Phycisphaerae bacterium]